MAKKNPIKAVKDFWYGKPHSAEEGGRRLGELYEDKTGLLKHREWRGVKDTFYYMYNIWGYNYVHMVLDILKFSNNPIDFVKGTWQRLDPPDLQLLQRRYPSARRQEERRLHAHDLRQ